MGYAQIQHNTTSEVLNRKVAVALQEFVSLQLTGAPPVGDDAKLVTALLTNSAEAAKSVTFKIVTDDGITPDSTDAEINGAVNQASTKTHMLWKLRIQPAP